MNQQQGHLWFCVIKGVRVGEWEDEEERLSTAMHNNQEEAESKQNWRRQEVWSIVEFTNEIDFFTNDVNVYVLIVIWSYLIWIRGEDETVA